MLVNYATVFDARNIHYWSGLGYYLGKMLEQQGHSVNYLNDLQLKNHFIYKLKARLFRQVLDRTYSPNFDTRVAEQYAEMVGKRVPPGGLILSPNTVILSKLNSGFKKVLFTDATFNRLHNFYPAFSNIQPRHVQQAQEIERKALQHCDLLIYTSKWAAESATKHYGADPSKIAIVPFGPNIDLRLNDNDVEEVIVRRAARKEIHLILIGVAWYRKGSDYALEVIDYLLKKGYDAKLHLVGLRNPPSKLHGHVINHGFISKKTIQGQQKIVEILKNGDFLLLPSRADCTPVAVSEANAFALPCLLSNVGGNACVVSNNRNGHLFDFTKGPQECGDYIISMKNDAAAYHRLCIGAFETFKEELNWETSGRKVTELLKSLQ